MLVHSANPESNRSLPLTARSISYAYSPAAPVLREVDADIPAGRVTAIIGPNGAGKSTLLRILLGVITPDSGRVEFKGVHLNRIPRRLLAARLAYIPQYSTVAFPFAVRDVVRLGHYAAGGSDASVERAMRDADIADRAGDSFGVLSAGQQQRVAVARALAQLGERPDAALLADEPISAMDPAHALRTLGLFRSLASRGVAVAVVLHDLHLVSLFTDRAIVLGAGGSVIASGPVREVLTTETLARAFGVPFREWRDPLNPDGPVLPAPCAPSTIGAS